MNRDNVNRILEELRLLFATRKGKRLTAGQVRQIITSTNYNGGQSDQNNR